jgi:hypothetical protein
MGHRGEASSIDLMIDSMIDSIRPTPLPSPDITLSTVVYAEVHIDDTLFPFIYILFYFIYFRCVSSPAEPKVLNLVRFNHTQLFSRNDHAGPFEQSQKQKSEMGRSSG